MRKILAAVFGFAVGIITAPLALGVWPVFCAWFFYSEADA